MNKDLPAKKNSILFFILPAFWLLILFQPAQAYSQVVVSETEENVWGGNEPEPLPVMIAPLSDSARALLKSYQQHQIEHALNTPLVTSCPNSNFSTGTFASWVGAWGTWPQIGAVWYPNELDTNTVAPWPHNHAQCYGGTSIPNCPPLHSIIAAPGTWDVNTGDSLISVFPGETYSTRLGHPVGGTHKSQLKYTVYVDNSTYLFIYRYAVVLQLPNPPHDSLQQPSFTIAIEDSTGALIDPTCGYYYIYAHLDAQGNPPPTWHKHGPIATRTMWKEWTTVGMSLMNYTGRHISIVFTALDCQPGGHYGYAYLSTFCSYIRIKTSMCQGDSSATLIAPPGFRYLWNTGPGDTLDSLVVPHPVTGAAYSCRLTSVNGCKVTIHDTLTYTVIHSNFTHGPGCIPIQFYDSSYVNQNSVVNWKWNFGDGTPVVTGVANPVHSYSASGDYNVKLISYSTEGCRDSIIKSVHIDTLPTISNPIHREQLCSNNPTNIVLNSNVSSALYTWTATGSSGTITGFSNGTVPGPNIINQTIINSGTHADSVTYVIHPQKGSCVGPAFTYVVKVFPKPNVIFNPVTPVYCSNQLTNIALSSGVTGLVSFTWTAVPGSGNISGYGPGIGTPIAQTLVTTGIGVETVTYRVVPSANGCPGDTTNKVVTVNPKPHLITNPMSNTICSLSPTSIPLNSSCGGTTFTWTSTVMPGSNVSGNGAGVGSPIVNTLTNNLPTTGQVNYTIHSVTATCVGNDTTYSEFVNALPTATISGANSVCQNSVSPLITFTGGTTSPPYTFTYNINGGSNQIVSTTVGNSLTIAAPTNVVGNFTYNLVSVQDGTPQACSQSQPASVLITVNPLPTGTILTNTSSVCQNAASPVITFTGAGGTAPYTFTYNINGAANQFVTTIVGNSVTVPAPTNITGTFTYNLVSVQDGSSTTCSQLQTGNAIVTVNLLPTAAIAGANEVCQNGVSPLITFTGGTTTPPYTFTYNINGGANQMVTTTVGNSVTVAAPTNVVGNFTYNLVSVQDGTPQACSQSQPASVLITVNPLPTATILANTYSVCQNASSPLITFTGASATAPYTFTYNINGGANQQVTTVVGNSVTVSAPTNVVGVFTYNLISVKDASSTTCSQPQSGSVTINVNPLPTATIAGTNWVCQNATSPLVTFTGASASVPYTFTYNINGGANQQVTTVAGNSVTVAAPTNVVGSFTYNLISVQDGSATACSQLQSHSVTVTVNPLPTASISGAAQVCQNTTMPSIIFTGGSSTPPYTFTYNINGGTNLFVTTTVGNSVAVAAPTNVVGSFTYNLLSVMDGSSTTCSQPQTESVTIVVNPLPTASISGYNSVCQNAPSPLITFTGGSSTPPYTFTYNINGGGNQFVTTSVGNSVTVPVPTNITGTFTYNLLSVQDGSTITCSQPQSGMAVVNVNLLPTATIGSTASVCQNGASPMITFTGGTTTAPYTFTYNINGGSNQMVTTTVGNSIAVPAPTNVVGSFTYNLISVQDGSPTTCSQLQPGSATITVNPLPTASIIGTNSVCQNAVSPLITFTGASGTAPYTFTYNINGGGNQFVTTTVGNSVTVAAPTNVVGAFTYNLISVKDASSTTCSQPQSSNITINVNPLPTATIAGQSWVCQNATSPLVTFTGASASAPYTFTYNINGGVNQQVTTVAGNSITVAAPTNVVGSFTYNLISVQDGSGTACSQLQSQSVTVTVNPLPTASIGSTIAVCQNAPSPLITFTGGSSTAPYTFTYNINGGANKFVTTAAGNSVTVAAPTNVVGVFTYNLISVTDGSTTLCTQPQTGSATVTIYALPVPTVVGPASVCLNSTTTYSTEASMTNYNWSVSASGSITGGQGTNTITIQWNFSGANTIQVNYINGNGCTATVPSTYTVSVNTLPVPAFYTGLTSICVGLPSTYTTDAGMNNYSWSVSAGGTITAGGGTSDKSATVLWNTPGPQTVSVNYFMGTGCTATVPSVDNVTVKPRPVITNASNYTLCSTGTTNITPAADLPLTTFSWIATPSSGSVTGFTSGSTPPIVNTLVNSGFNIENVNYTVTPNLNGCDGTVAHYIVTVNPVSDVIFTPNGQSFCSGGTTSIALSSHVAGTTFTWTATGSSGNISGYGPGSGDTISQVLINTGPWFENVNYDVFTLANSCSGHDSHVIVNMNPTPQVSLNMECNDLITTTDAKPFILRGGIPLGGSYVGIGVSAGTFYPSLAGPGAININYSYANTWGCNANQSQLITVVNPVPFNCDDMLTDLRDGKQYPTIKIGTQCWMAKNLDYGTQIPSASTQRDNCVWEKYCYQEITTNCTSMGGLYQWDEMMRYQLTPALQGICPPAWHVPTEDEWTTLFNNYISNGFAGSPLKSSGYSGFNALLDGVLFDEVKFDFTTFSTFIWSSTSEGTNKAWAHAFNTFNPSVSTYPGNRSNAFVIRCLKD
jgi:uncharacterized protein (TIGR02145 family)